MIRARPYTEPEIGPDTPVTICQLADEFDRVLALYQAAKPRRVLEIGTASGGTLYHWIRNAAKGATIVSVDLPEPDYELDRDQCQEWALNHAVDLLLIAGDSHDPRVIEEITETGPYDWVFIDGNHRYDHVAADISAYWPLVSTDGYLLLHDIALKRTYEDGTEAGVYRAWRELRRAGYWCQEIRTQPLIPAYGIGIVKGPPVE